MQPFLRYIIPLCMLLPLAVTGQEQTDTTEDSQADTRENPEIDGNTSTPVAVEHSIDYSPYQFLHLGANRIELNGADWTPLCDIFTMASDTVINILHIGDSHIQAEGSTSCTRRLLQQRYGNAGRGLIIPFRMAGTNQPLDYAVSSDTPFSSSRLLKTPWPTDMGFTGIATMPHSDEFRISISLKGCSAASDFSCIRVFHSGATPDVTDVASSIFTDLIFTTAQGNGYLDINLFEPVTAADITFVHSEPLTIYGYELMSANPGVIYSAIGNNGATYSTYNTVSSVGTGISPMQPQLVILSLGTNEAFGKVSDATMYRDIDILVKDILRANPQTQILLTTPSECQRTVSRRVRRKKKGKRRRYYTVRSRQVNTNIPRLRQVVLKYGRDHAIATYDWYDVAGGAGSSSRWVSASLMGKDHIHNTWTGYDLQGNLLYEALIQTIDR